MTPITLKCEAAIVDASTYLKTIEDFEKKYKVVRRIESTQMLMMANPMFGKNGMHIPGQPKEIPGVFIAIVFIYEAAQGSETENTKVVPLISGGIHKGL